MAGSIEGIQVLRALAALGVVAVHVQGELRVRGLHDFLPDLAVGSAGVDLFFVISGFIMVYASRADFAASGALRVFALKRLARIVPLYWLCTALFEAASRAVGQGHAWPHLAASLLFVPYTDAQGTLAPAYALGWTLNYEMFFYALFALALLLTRGRAVVAVSSALVLLVAVSQSLAVPTALAFWGAPQVLEFVLGMWIAEAYLRGWRLRGAAAGALVLAGAAAAVALTAALGVPGATGRLWMWGLPAAAIVAGVVLAPGERALPGTRALEALGDASYSLYLFHPLAFLAVRRLVLLGGLDAGLPAPVYAILLVLASVVSALALFRWFEHPLTRFLQRRLGAATVRGSHRGSDPYGRGAHPSA